MDADSGSNRSELAPGSTRLWFVGIVVSEYWKFASNTVPPDFAQKGAILRGFEIIQTSIERIKPMTMLLKA